MKVSYCKKEKKPCVKWINNYFKDCLCNLNDEISFGFGVISLICWGVAEIPQIITNFKTKSGHGVSLAFLSTWIVGDIFNLVGCILEPATLPTQYYTALLYTMTTVALVVQCIYYDHFLQWWKCTNNKPNMVIKDEEKPFKPKAMDSAAPNAPVEVPRRREFYYISARSLAGSDTPPLHSFIKAKSGPSALEHETDSSSEDEIIPPYSNKPWRIPSSAGYGSFLAVSANFPLRTKALMGTQMEVLGRRLLEENIYGQWLGWLMAGIYMGGRIPQIWLNIKRGSVEGLNPLMFIFALIANATYVGSILVRSIEWEQIKANMPWLLDAIVCVALDLFIILQYVYYKYKYMRRNKIHHRFGEEDYGDFIEAKNAAIS